MADNGEAPKQRDALGSVRFHHSEHKLNVWVADLEVGTTREEILNPGFWATNAGRLTRRDIIHAFIEDNSKLYVLRVLECARNWAKVFIEQEHNYVTEAVQELPPSLADQYEARWRGEHHGHCVIRKKDGEVVQSKLATKQAALNWITEHVRTVG